MQDTDGTAVEVVVVRVSCCALKPNVASYGVFMALWYVIFMVYEISRVHLHHLSILVCTLLIITAVAFSFHVLFALSTSPWVVGVRGDPWAIWMPFS